VINGTIFFPGTTAPRGPGPPHYILRHTTLGRTLPYEWSDRRRDLYLYSTQLRGITRHRHPCHRWDSNPHSQQASGRGPTPLTEGPLGSAFAQ